MQGLRALIVDDDIDQADSLSQLLQLLGYRTAVAYGGDMGLRIADLFHPSVVFVDLNMPGRDGCSVVAEAKVLSASLAGAAFVCVTASARETDERRCLDAGFHHFLRKPYTSEELRQVLDELEETRPSCSAGYAA